MPKHWVDELHRWWIWRKEHIGFVIAALAFISLALVIIPFTRGSIVEGTIIDVRKLGHKGVDTYAVIRTGGEEATVRLSFTAGCQVGSIISVQKRRSLTGSRYSAPYGCRLAPESGRRDS